MFSRLDDGSNVQKPISSTLSGSGCKEHEDDNGSSFLSIKICKTCENVGGILRITLKDVRSVPERSRDKVEPILGKKFAEYASG